MVMTTIGAGERRAIPSHRMEARNIKVVEGMKIVQVTFLEPYDGFKGGDTVNMYLREYDELKRTCVRTRATIIGSSIGELMRDNVSYRFGHFFREADNKMILMSARVGAIGPVKRCKPPKLHESADAGPDNEEKPKRRRGRPPGSKNKRKRKRLTKSKTVRKRTRRKAD